MSASTPSTERSAKSVFSYSARLASVVLFIVLLNSVGASNASAEKNFTYMKYFKGGGSFWRYIVVHEPVLSSNARKSCPDGYQLAAYNLLLHIQENGTKIKEPFACWLSAKFEDGMFLWEEHGQTTSRVLLTGSAIDPNGTVFVIFKDVNADVADRYYKKSADSGYFVEPAGTRMARHSCCMKNPTESEGGHEDPGQSDARH